MKVFHKAQTAWSKMFIFAHVNIEVYIVEWLSRLGQKPIYMFRTNVERPPSLVLKKAYH